MQTAERYQLIHRYTPQLGWIDQIRWFVAHSPHERDFTGDRRRRLANGQLDKLDFLLNYKEQFTEGDIQLNSSFNTPFATHKLTYGAYASVTETDYQRRDITTNLTTRAWSPSPTPADSISRTRRPSAPTASSRTRSSCSTTAGS